MDFRLSGQLLRSEFDGSRGTMFCLPLIESCFLFQERDRVS